ncbi:hypothetical protein FHT78_000942 [Rhizobium sp. BK196]|uniref:hypothetical protein n=1 Tax=Rhizobium sp. BK196 TaxID=2587073 RepID=UPI001800D8B7|nr:hypothetical protein [Rhizobium sp. BK196]MBB3309213.1 hypothetical protein [Rhizobium sp. BK196]
MIAYFLVGAFGRKEKKKNKKGSYKNKQRAANNCKKSVLNGIIHGSVCSTGSEYSAVTQQGGNFATSRSMLP